MPGLVTDGVGFWLETRPVPGSSPPPPQLTELASPPGTPRAEQGFEAAGPCASSGLTTRCSLSSRGETREHPGKEGPGRWGLWDHHLG